ncbi:MAG: nucleotide exchange factor GrpE [Bdellovibrionales bacterium]|nr:nucleotide exchange factor GrpE [Bdellovibrionales bacterium]
MNASQHTEVLERLLAMQKGFISCVENLRNENKEAVRQMDLLIIGHIEILDLFDHLPENNSSDQLRLLRKTERRLKALLGMFGVTEIEVKENHLKPGLVRVLESTGGANFQVCRRGYMRGNRVLRPAEIIT